MFDRLSQSDVQRRGNMLNACTKEGRSFKKVNYVIEVEAFSGAFTSTLPVVLNNM